MDASPVFVFEVIVQRLQMLSRFTVKADLTELDSELVGRHPHLIQPTCSFNDHVLRSLISIWSAIGEHDLVCMCDEVSLKCGHENASRPLARVKSSQDSSVSDEDNLRVCLQFASYASRPSKGPVPDGVHWQ